MSSLVIPAPADPNLFNKDYIKNFESIYNLLINNGKPIVVNGVQQHIVLQTTDIIGFIVNIINIMDMYSENSEEEISDIKSIYVTLIEDIVSKSKIDKFNNSSEFNSILDFIIKDNELDVKIKESPFVKSISNYKQITFKIETINWNNIVSMIDKSLLQDKEQIANTLNSLIELLQENFVDSSSQSSHSEPSRLEPSQSSRPSQSRLEPSQSSLPLSDETQIFTCENGKCGGTTSKGVACNKPIAKAQQSITSADSDGKYWRTCSIHGNSVPFNSNRVSQPSQPSRVSQSSQPSQLSSSHNASHDAPHTINVRSDKKCGGTTNSGGSCQKSCSKKEDYFTEPDSNGVIWRTCASHGGTKPNSATSGMIAEASVDTERKGCFAVTQTGKKCGNSPSKDGFTTDAGNPACSKHNGYTDFFESKGSHNTPVSTFDNKCFGVTNNKTKCKKYCSKNCTTIDGFPSCNSHNGKDSFKE